MRVARERIISADRVGERIAVLEAKINYLSLESANLQGDVRTLLDKFSQMTGGKKALMALFAVLGFLLGAAGSLMSLLLGRH